MRVYIAGPYSEGDTAVNVARAIAAADAVLCAGHTPFLPHLSHFWHLLHHHPYEMWMAYTRVWLMVCDALIRLSGESPGVDSEAHLARSQQIPVYYSVEEFLHGNPPTSAPDS